MAKAKRKGKPGRKPKPVETKQAHRVTVYLTLHEQEHLEAEAKREGLSLASTIMLPWRKKWAKEN